MASENEFELELSDGDDYVVGDVSLESILAEYKGTAYIDGDKRTPTEILNEQADRIVKEALGDMEMVSMPLSADLAVEEDEFADFMPTESEEYSGEEAMPLEAESEPRQNVTYFTSKDSRHSLGTRSDVEGTYDSEPDEEMESVMMFFENYRSPEAQQESDETLIEDVGKAIERELGYNEEPGDFTRLSIEMPWQEPIDEAEYVEDVEEEEFKEPDLKDAMKRFTEELTSITLRFIPAAVITIIITILTLAAQAELILPFGIGRSEPAAIGAMLIMLLIVMMLCIDIIVRGAIDLIRGAPNVETLLLFSCALSIVSGVYTMLSVSVSVLPYCAVSAVSLTIAAFGERLSLRAITDTIKTSLASSEPYGVQAEYNKDIDKSVLKKAYNRRDGFYNNLIHPDISETAYRYATPILIAAALLLTVITTVVNGTGDYFLHTLSAMFAAAAPFSAMLAFAIPFGIVAKSSRKSGAAIAGWGGVDDICYTNGVGVTDDDLFPTGTLSFNGIKVYEGGDPEKAVLYTASLIMASGSGLSRIFSEVLDALKMPPIRVEEFACYEGGISARLQGDLVVTGSAAFMKLLSIKVPDDMKNAVFTAINGELVVMFPVEYIPVNSVQVALISMLKWRIKLFFAMRDFNITPSMLEQKFKVSLKDIEYIQAKDSYSISDSYSGRQGRMAALLTREGLGPFAEAITGARLLKVTAFIATAVSVFSAALGVLFMFYLFWNGAFLSAQPGNLLLFMLCMLAAVVVICGYVKFRK